MEINFQLIELNMSLRNIFVISQIFLLFLMGKSMIKLGETVSGPKSFVDIEALEEPKPFYDTKVKMIWDEELFLF
jgi:hypothetical protein